MADIDMTGPITISSRRRLVALESTWETSALLESLSLICADLAANGGGAADIYARLEFELQARGLRRRLEQLNSVVMSVLDDADAVDSVENHERLVHGHVLHDRAVAH